MKQYDESSGVTWYVLAIGEITTVKGTDFSDFSQRRICRNLFQDIEIQRRRRRDGALTTSPKNKLNRK